jgi:hypothetical protein
MTVGAVLRVTAAGVSVHDAMRKRTRSAVV